MTAAGPMRIGLLAPLVSPIPPTGYAGTERIVATLAQHLHQRGHEVTLFGSGDSEVDCRLVPVIPRSLWASGYGGDGRQLMPLVVTAAWRELERFDLLHSHIEGAGFVLARHCGKPVVTTLHTRLDTDGMPQLLEAFTDVPLVAISESQRRWAPDANWVATIHHGIVTAEMPFGPSPGDYLLLVGRVTSEKGIAEAIEVARETQMPLKLAGKVHEDGERRTYTELVEPAIADGTVEFVGELDPGQRDALFAGARATLMLGAWPEPFGLVAIESMATGTPIIGRRAGALPETVRHGETGFLVDDMTEARLAVQRVAELDRKAIRRSALERFAPEVMVDRYEEAYRRLLAG